jgi:hypothetical protein
MPCNINTNVFLPHLTTTSPVVGVITCFTTNNTNGTFVIGTNLGYVYVFEDLHGRCISSCKYQDEVLNIVSCEDDTVVASSQRGLHVWDIRNKSIREWEIGLHITCLLVLCRNFLCVGFKTGEQCFFNVKTGECSEWQTLHNGQAVTSFTHYNGKLFSESIEHSLTVQNIHIDLKLNN